MSSFKDEIQKRIDDDSWTLQLAGKVERVRTFRNRRSASIIGAVFCVFVGLFLSPSLLVQDSVYFDDYIDETYESIFYFQDYGPEI